MSGASPWIIVVLGLGLGLGTAGPAAGASFHGKSVDGRRYQASILNSDYGHYDNVEVKFQGDNAAVYFHGGGRLVLTLEDEEITDPHEIRAQDLRRGIVWEINVRDLRQ